MYTVEGETIMDCEVMIVLGDEADKRTISVSNLRNAYFSVLFNHLNGGVRRTVLELVRNRFLRLSDIDGKEVGALFAPLNLSADDRVEFLGALQDIGVALRRD